MFIFFLFVVHGNSLFGLLATRASKLLGTISYSIYLVHCIALFVVMRAVNVLVPVGTLSPLEYWSFAAAAALLAVCVSALTYRYVEHPFLSASGLPRVAARRFAPA
jgi:peptidoglycan/LPS O-acetylase OafA/YrhL